MEGPPLPFLLPGGGGPFPIRTAWYCNILPLNLLKLIILQVLVGRATFERHFLELKGSMSAMCTRAPPQGTELVCAVDHRGTEGTRPPNQKVGRHYVVYPPNHDGSAGNVIFPSSEATSMPVSCRPHSSLISELMTMLSVNKYKVFFTFFRHIVVLLLLLDSFFSPSVSINSASYHST